MWVPRLLLPPERIRIFGPKPTRPCQLIFALLVGWLVVVARGLYLARHLFTLCNLEEFIGYKNDEIIVSQCFQYLATSAPCLRLLLRQRLEARRNVSSELMRSYLRRFRHHSSENRNYSSLSLGLCICLAFCYHTLHWSV